MFAGAEMAIVSLRKSRLQQLLDEGKASAKAVAQLRSHPERFLATVQVGITVISASAAAYGGSSIAEDIETILLNTPLPPEYAHEVAFISVVASISFLSIVLGELVPKSLALRSAETYALIIGRPLLWVSWLARPIVWLLTACSNIILRPFGDKTTFTESRLSVDELQLLVEEVAKSGSVEAQIGEIASRALDFGEITAEDIMVPRNRIVAAARNATIEDLRTIILASGHSRVPIYKDEIDNIVGYVTVIDVLRAMATKTADPLAGILRKVLFVPEMTTAMAVLHQLQSQRMSLAIAVDEHGGVAGLLTLEDLVEELVGEIMSEHEVPQDLFVRESSGTYLIKGHTPLRDLNRALDLSLPDEDWTTLSGLCVGVNDAIPTAGMVLSLGDGTKLEVVDASSHLVRLVRLHKPVKTE